MKTPSNVIMKPIVDAAFTAANAEATLFNTIVTQWQAARKSGWTHAEFRTALVESLIVNGPYYTTTHTDGSTVETPVYRKATLNTYLMRIDESGFRVRAQRSDAKKDKAPKVRFNEAQIGEIAHACLDLRMSREDIKHLLEKLAELAVLPKDGIEHAMPTSRKKAA